MALTAREQIASATMIATHEVVSNLTRAKSAMENLVHEMADLTALLSGDGRVIWGNVTTATWLGVDHDVLHEKNLKSIFLEPQTFEDRLKFISSGLLEKDEFSLVLLINGKRRDILWTMKPFRAVSARRGLLVLITGHDITDVLKAQSDRAKLENELETAQILQQRFLPPGHIQAGRLEIASFYRPAEQCSGDWWGHFDLGGDRDLVCVADVTGHGAASALVTSMTQALCLSFVDRHQNDEVSPAALISEINGIIFKTFHGDMYMTFFALVIAHKKGEIIASNAAHNFPMVLRAVREAKQNPEALVVQGNPIGHAADSLYLDISYRTAPGDRFILYTDGLTECRNMERKMYGSGTFRRSIVRHSEEDTGDFRDKLMEDALSFYGEQPLADDITLVIVDVKK
ncbi:MAG: hypothetical protein EOP10_08900 [Proteobacteria bacterium]|nr:MAG: hypothetical protein EOP10_08900 [Pseudomonadota bacterium]